MTVCQTPSDGPRRPDGSVRILGGMSMGPGAKQDPS